MLTDQEKAIIEQALNIIESLYKREGFNAVDQEVTKQYCQLQIGHLPYEVCAALFLDVKLELIQFKQIFRGTVHTTAVFVREIAREAMICNASGVIMTHNHPSGYAVPSKQDLELTETISVGLEILNIHLLDHIIVTHKETFSFSEQGLL
jgi:DNA repair protein RadC